MSGVSAATIPRKIPEALTWLSRGLEEAVLAFLAKAVDGKFALHAAIYEFQKDDLLAGLAEAIARGADVSVVYHARDEKTTAKNVAAIKKAGLEKVVTPRAKSPSAIMHNKFVVLLSKSGAKLTPVAVWTGSTNWTDGGIYGQLNVGHAVFDPKIAAKYDAYFQLLLKDPSPEDSKSGNAKNTPVPATRAAIEHGTTPIFSPQRDLTMIKLYAEICSTAKVLMVCAPFTLHADIRKAFDSKPAGTLRFLLADKEGSFGKKGEIDIVQNNHANTVAVATVLSSPLNDFQGNLLEDKQSFHHAGVHIHSKIIAADPFGADPILVTGSANFSTNSTTENDSNSLIVRGDTAVMDIYATEFMRMFEHYWFRYRKAAAEKKAKRERQAEARGPDARRQFDLGGALLQGRRRQDARPPGLRRHRHLVRLRGAAWLKVGIGGIARADGQRLVGQHRLVEARLERLLDPLQLLAVLVDQADGDRVRLVLDDPLERRRVEIELVFVRLHLLAEHDRRRRPPGSRSLTSITALAGSLRSGPTTSEPVASAMR